MLYLNSDSPVEIQQSLAATVKLKRKQGKLSRAALAEKSTVPAPTIKKFETTGQISLRQFILLWQCVDDLDKLTQLTKTQAFSEPQSIAEVLNDQ